MAADGEWSRVFEVDGSRLRVLAEGPERLVALLDLIASAKATLRILFYIFADDASGVRVREAAAAAARRGVRVALIVDGFGCRADDAFFDPLRAAGATVCRFNPRWGRRFLLRNHQKLVLADDVRVIAGGFNVEDDYFGTAADGAWRDLGILVDGPAATRLGPYFDTLLDWATSHGAKLRDVRRLLDRASETEGRVRWLMGGPTRRLSPWGVSVRSDFLRARRVDMIAGYFAPNPRMMRGMERVTRRGGELRLLTAAKSDNDATIAAARHCYARLLRRGVRCFEYMPTKLHTKLFVIDDAVHLGSANFDVRSLYLNLELMLRIEDAGFAAAMRAYAAHERAEAVEITRAAHRRHGWLTRLRWGLAYSLVAVLDYNISRRLNFGPDGK